MNRILFLSILSIKLFSAFAYFIYRLITKGNIDLVTIGFTITILIFFALLNLYLSYQVLFYWCDLNTLNRTVGAIGMFPLFYIGVVFLLILSISYYWYNRMVDPL